MNLIPQVQRSLVLVAAALAAPAVLGQGALTPASGPTPMMKTLAQIEPRTPISALPFVISNSGSYYVTGNLTGASNSHGILILASDVSIDLGGFILKGGPGSLDGINAGNEGNLGAINTTNLVVLNGTLRNWGGTGLNASLASVARYEGLQLLTNGYGGISVGVNSVLRNCQSHFNLRYGFEASFGPALLESCTASRNQLDGFHVGGSVVMNCSASYNDGAGFSAFGNSTVSDCRSASNQRSGIETGHYGLILRNVCVNNNVANQPNAAGIRAFYLGSRIEGNLVQYVNNFGILVDDGVTDTVIVKNTTRGTLANSHSVPAGNDVGPWGQAATATSPWANIRN